MASLIDVANLEHQQQLPPSLAPGVPTAQRVRSIHSIQTDLLIQSFHDRILVILTQLGRIGCLIQVLPPPSTLPAALPRPPNGSASPSLPPPHPSLVLSPLFGVPPTPHIAALHDLYASHVASILFEKMSADTQGMEVKPVVLGIGLKRKQDQQEEGKEESEISEKERETFMQVMEMVKECIQ
ncbi:uncharacterized protein JCM6883_007564 [Sporobolomyces salmoneus]|uniref:uncharacterized protein n=1 Tax=Sporobolomyces salmoneus TaxID=183962 RepID=UPI00317865C4